MKMTVYAVLVFILVIVNVTGMKKSYNTRFDMGKRTVQERVYTMKRSSLISEQEIKVSGEIDLQVNEISSNVLQFIFRQQGVNRYELPEKDPFPYHRNKARNLSGNTEYSFEIVKEPFSFTVKRKTTDEIIFSTNGSSVVYSENYAEITTSLPSNNLFGLGERTTSFKIKPGTYTLYNRDAWGEIDDGSGGKNRYGTHPMYLMREASGNYHIVYLRNSYPMDAIFTQHDSGKQETTYSLTYKTVGGVLDFSIFLGDSNPETATKLYHEFLGKHLLPPFWSLGFHQCRWGYKNLDMIHDVLQKYKDNNLPLDTIWMDIDYMQDYVPFTVDETRFNLTDFKKYLETYRKKFVMIAEPAMSIKWPDYEYLIKGKQLDLFIKNKDGNYLINRVWPGDCYFIDYFHPNTPAYWHEALDKLHDKLNFSGVWLDMNEVATFEWGQVNEYDQKISCDDDTKYPYLPSQLALERNTICPNALHYEGYTHVQLHNYNPVMQQMLTNRFLEKKFPDQFPFILSRANSAGTGKWSFHWTGDNVGDFRFYKGSVSEVLNNNIFGIPMVGADICGFAGNTPEILCSKFYQMGSLFPFSRSHAANDSVRKEPWAMGETLLQTVKKSLTFRYQILKYYYSLFISNAGAGTVFRPLFFNFNDEEVLKESVLDNQFMIGQDLLVVPNFNDDDSTTKVNAYFPSGSWYDLRYNTQISSTGTYLDIEAPLKEMPPVFLRGGRTIFTNNVDKVENSYDLNDTFNLLIAFNSSQGNLLTSQGKIPALNNYHSKTRVNNCINNNCFINIISTYSMNTKILTVSLSQANFYDTDYTGINIKSLRIYGIRVSQIESTNLDKLISHELFLHLRTPDTINYLFIPSIDNSYIDINLLGELNLQKEKIDIYFKFK